MMAAGYCPSSLQAACGPVVKLVWSPLLFDGAMGQFVLASFSTQFWLKWHQSDIRHGLMYATLWDFAAMRITKRSSVVLVLLPGHS